MPKEWYIYKHTQIQEGDDEETIKEKLFNQSILANKKPYFFIYNYPSTMFDYKKFIKKAKNSCLQTFGLTVDELLSKEDKTHEELEFLRYYDILNPVSMSPSTMNRICWRIEKEFDKIRYKWSTVKFDTSIIVEDVETSIKQRQALKRLYNKYIDQAQNYAVANSKAFKNSNARSGDARKIFFEMMEDSFEEEALSICNNMDTIKTILIKETYKPKKNKQFMWTICGRDIVSNLLEKNSNQINYFEKDTNGEIEYKGMKFTMKKKTVR